MSVFYAPWKPTETEVSRLGAVKNGSKTILRTPGKALLFFLVLALLAALLAVSFSVFTAVRGYLRDCDDYYHTIVNLEYLGKDYPDGTVYDEALVRAVEEQRPTLDALCSMEQVLSFEPASNTLARVEGLHRRDKFSFDPDAAVMRVYISDFDESFGVYDAVVDTTLYSGVDNTKKLICLRIWDMDFPDSAGLERGATYLVCGHYYLGMTNYIWFQAEPMEIPGTDVTVPGYTRWQREEPAEAPLYEQLADCCAQLNDGCPVQFTAALEDQLPFHQQAVTIERGRMFSAEETGVCVISEHLAAMVECACGDILQLSLRRAQGALYIDSEEVPSEAYEVVGIYSRSDEYPYDIYLPSQTEPARVSAVSGYRLGQFRVQNSELAAFLEAAQPLEQHGFRLTVYDQGYSVAVEAMQDLVLLSGVFLAVCLSLCVAFLCLQSHLFISRQRDTAQTMLALGSGKPYVRSYFLSGALLLALPSGLLGVWVGKRLERYVMGLLAQLTQAMATEDLRFSSSRLSLVRTLEFAPTISLWVYGAAFGTLVLLSAVLTLLFSRGALRDRAVKRIKRKKTPRMPHACRSSHLKGPLKYALLSMRRSTLRTLAVLLLCLTVAMFFGQLTNSLQSYEDQLEALRQNTVLTGHATDLHGQKLDGLMVSTKSVDSFVNSGLLESYSLSRNVCNLRFVGVPARADGTEYELAPPVYPTKVETLMGQMATEPMWQRCTSVSGNSQFYYASPTSLQWLEGYSEESFLSGELCCALPQPLAEQYGVALGDTCRFLFVIWNRIDYVIDTVDLKVVAIYQSATDSRTILSPIAIHAIPARMSSAGSVWLSSGSFNSFVFTLKDTDSLGQARKELAGAGFNYVRSGKRTGSYVVIDDEVFLSTAHGMERQIKYVRALYTCLYIIAGILCLALSWLLTALRKKELALMRALGTQPWRITANLHFEQSALCAVGLGLGLGLWRLLGKPFTKLQLLLTLAFFGIWSLTTLICVLAGMRKQAYADLAEPE